LRSKREATLFREVERRLKRFGFIEVGQTGSHVKFIKMTDLGSLVAIVPKHKEVASGTLRSILKQAGLSEKEFSEL
jgi:predicted RNA binding protein YcfA (HicA-like mRNA interferase family)